jgi:microcystin-dependent protein
LPKSASVTATIVQTVPVGTVVSNIFSPSDLPPGWLPCDGSTFNADHYPLLFQKLGNKNVLPDLRGYFLRSLDPTGKVDPEGAGRAPLSVQQDQFASHTHSLGPMSNAGASLAASYKYYWADRGGSLTTGAAGGNETRPKNVAVHYIIFAGMPS